MDDTIVLATSRQCAQEKLNLVHEASVDLEMKLHPSKSQYIVVNSYDDEPFIVGNIVVSHTTKYVYLGATVSNNTISAQLEDHIRSKQAHLIKFSSFLRKNSEAPFHIKQRVWESAMSSSVLYGCETWLTNDMATINTALYASLKDLLGVRVQTPNDLILVELGFSPPTALIKKRQKNFLDKMTQSTHFKDSPLEQAIELSKSVRSPMGQYLESLQSVWSDLNNIKTKVQSSTSSRAIAYKELNPDLSAHKMYTTREPMQESHQLATARIRLSHKLKIETGRWSGIPEKGDCALVVKFRLKLMPLSSVHF